MNPKIIKQIIDCWDPMDLLSHAPKDEYDLEILQIEALLNRETDVAALGKGIERIFTDAFGADSFRRPRSECLAIARKLLAAVAPICLLGVYPIPNEENVYLIELWISIPPQQLDLSRFSQMDPRLKKSDWQVPYDESYLNSDGTEVLGDFFSRDTITGEETRIAFFLYTEDRRLPLSTPWGEISLEETQPMPERLQKLAFHPMD